MSDWLTPKEPGWEPPAQEQPPSAEQPGQPEQPEQASAAQPEQITPPESAAQWEPVSPPVPPVQREPVSAPVPVPPAVPPVPPVPPVQTGWQPPQQAGWQRPSVYGGYAPYTPPGYTPPVQQPYTSPQGAFAPPQGGNTPPAIPEKPRRSRGTGILLTALSLIAVAAIVCAVALTAPWKGSSGGGAQTPGGSTNEPGGTNPTGNITIDVNEPAEEGLPTVDIVRQNLDSTVVITMYDRVSSGGWGGGGGSSEQQVGAASGIVWKKEGYIITNAHVVYSEELGKTYARIEVTLWNGKKYDAKVVGYDQHTDLAVIKVEADDLAPATFGKSTQLQLGERVVVLGNNASYSWSVTQGIISGLARDVYEETAFAIKCLQTDAVINPGNSGGPLINTSGQVVGINSAKIVQEGYEGIGFSIPIEEARPILESLSQYGYVKGRVMLGITGRTVTAAGYEGFRIEGINNDSPLKGTEARQGDIITHVNGARVKSYGELSTELNKNKVGDTVTITIMRVDTFSGNSSSKDIEVKLIEAK